MKLAIIPPIAYLKEYSTNFHLVLAHLYRQSEVYRDFYCERRRKGDFVIMDNGAAELGSSIGPEELVTMAIQLRPNILVCPDVLRNKAETVKASSHFLDAYSAKLHQLGIKLMAVPQGQTAEEWEESFIWFDCDPAIDWLGISKYVKGAFPARLDALRMIEGRVHKKCHLLGMADDIWVVEKEKKFRFIQSTDTAVPVKLGLQKLALGMYSYRGPMTDDEYFGYPKEVSEDQKVKVLDNIKRYKELCR